MTVIEKPKPAAREPQLYPLSVAAFHALGERGLVPRRTELLHGQIYHKKPKPPLHSYLAQKLFTLLDAATPAGCYASPGQPITGPDSELEPDLAVIRGSCDDFRNAHPTTAELVMEICVSSHEYDRAKLRAYAQAGVKECWLVLGPEKQIEVHRQPVGEQYAESAIHGPGGALASVAMPGTMVELENLFAA